jgi:hypothetical protein
MSNAVIVQFAVISVIVAVGVCFLYVKSKKREQFELQNGLEVAGLLEGQGEKILADISEDVQRLIPAGTPALLEYAEPNAENKDGGYVRRRREVIARDPQVRFTALQEWVSINMLAIFRRALRDWNTAKDLIAIIPAYLEAQAEILDGRILLIGTRGHTQQLAIPIRDLDLSSDAGQYFDFVTNAQKTMNSPAVMLRSNGHLELVSRGIIAQAALRRSNGRQHHEVPECIVVAGVAVQASESVFRKYVQEFFQPHAS